MTADIPIAAGMADIDGAALARAVAAMQARRSIRRYDPQPIAREVIEQLLRAATFAPSAHNRQPWRFAVLQGHACKARLAHAMGERLRRDRLADGDAIADIDADVARSHARITGAPVVLLVASSLRDMDTYPDERRRRAEAAMAMQSTAMAVQNMLLAASAAGLEACWMCAPLFCPDAAREALALPPDWQAQGLVTLGLPASAPPPRPRKPLAEIVRWVDEP